VRLNEAMEALQRNKTHVTTNWPVCSAEEQSQMAAEKEQSQFVPVDRAFADMKGIPLSELHRKLEEHNARRKEYGWE
jgi:hypothetical protein